MVGLATWAGKLNYRLLSLNACANTSKFTQAPPVVTRKFRNGFFRIALAMSLGILWSSAHAVTAPIGATSGSFSVSSSGAATYSIPIVVPPGTNGMAPKLSLNYNSLSGNGLVGMGWSIGGLSVIHRCGATIVLDGFKGGVNYDSNDKFCLDGERLIWSATDSSYRTQHESWQKVSIVGSYFTVTMKDGTVMTYGGTTNSQILALGKPSTIRIWALNKIQDRNGNYLTITYQNNGFTTGEYYPSSIAYTGNGGVAPYNFIYFDYQSRTDIVPYYEGGSLIQTTQRLSGIRSCTDTACTAGVNGSRVRLYSLVYDSYGGALGRSRLSSIQECGTDAICLPPTTVSWVNGGEGATTATGFNPVQTVTGNWTSYSIYPGDYNGDGNTDLFLVGQSASYFCAGPGIASQNNCVQTVTGDWTVYRIYSGDYNGDGNIDLFLVGQSASYFCAGPGIASQNNCVQTVTGDWTSYSTYPGDFNGDGTTDLFLVGPTGSYFCNGPTAVITNGANCVRVYVGDWKSGYTNYVGDFNGDGTSDLFHVGSAASSFVAGGLGTPDRLTNIASGLGVQTSITYKPLTDSTVYTPNAAPYKCTSYPCQDVQNATYVVSQITQSDGLGGNNASSILYGGLKTHLAAGASLGFRWMQTTDPTGLVTKATYNQITTADNSLNGLEGTPFSTETWFGNVRVKYTGNSWTPVTLQTDAAGRVQRTFTRPAATVEETRELNNSVVTTVNTSYSGYDAYGNPGTVTVNFNDGYIKTTTNTYNNDTTNWYLGQLLQSQVTAQALGQPTLTRTSSFTYNSANRLASETIEPGSAMWLTSTYTYDPTFGNRIKKTVTGADIPQRDEYILVYYGNGQYVYTRTNAAGHVETYNSYDVHGSVASLTGPNGITTTWTYDGFGRKTGESRADGTTTTINYKCWNNTVPTPPATCATGTGYATQTYGSGAGDVWVYYDILGRPSRTARISFANAWVYTYTNYDNLGRTIQSSQPEFSNPPVNYTAYTYDTLGRVLTATAPGNRVTSTVYNGLTTTATFTAPNTQTQTKSVVKNSQGKVASSADAAGTTSYGYDSIGNLVQVTDPFGNVSNMTYNIRGFKTAMHDPDMGNWSYGYDALGQLKSQTDAKGQVISMDYDLLGRMTIRTLPNGEGTSNWYYDTATKGVGKLASVTNPNANETYTYDSLGRLSTATTSIGGVTYTVTTAYDAYSRVDTVTYPETGFALKHVYDPNSFGFLTEVKNASTNASYWKINTGGVDAMNRILNETYGNNLIGTHAYNSVTGDLTAIQTGISGNLTSVQSEAYGFDGVGNLLSRSWWDGTATRSESFGYDNLNRLRTVTGPVAKTYNYDTIGNLTFKSDVGNYSYPASGASSIQPHAVSATSGGAVTTSFTYDANGNMLTGNGKTVTYTSFNKAKTIQKGTTTDTLTYDASFNRIVKSNASGSTVYIGKLYERNTSGTTVTQKHYIYAGNNIIGVYNKINGSATNTRYFHTDNLGSVDIITNETGAVLQRLSYDAWGKRRNANGTDATSITAQATRGFTAHEHDDEVTLINMNAREYDPIIARFISPDTIIPGALNSQAYNRYTYVNNNPLSYTDPTGHFSLRKAVQNIARISVASIVGPSVVAAKATYQVHVEAYRYTKRHVDQTLLNHQWARTALMAASVFCGPAAPYCAATSSTYIAHISGASNQDALKSGARAYVVSDIMSTEGTGANAPWYEKAVVSGVQGGIASSVQGGHFKDGFRQGGEFSVAQSWTDYLARESGLTAKDPDNGKLRTDGVRDSIDGSNDASIFGSTRMKPEGSGLHWYENITPIRVLIVDVSKVHDAMNSWMYSWTGKSTGLFVPTGNMFLDSFADVYSFAGMIPAAQFTLQSPQYNPVIIGGYIN